MNFFKSKLFLAATLALSLGACSKKDVKSEGDMAGDAAAADVNKGPVAGTPIPELGAVYFAYDSFAIGSEAKKTLEAHTTWLMSNSNKAVQIEGHCDERGTEEYNLALGDRRAAAVKDYLVKKGVPATQLSTISYGEERAADQGHDEAAWSKNRRAMFVSAGQ